MNPKTKTARRLFAGLFITLVALAGTLTLSSTAKSLAPFKKNRYIGAEACESCHSLEAAGDQYHKWKEAKHASAFELLKSDDAIKVGKERGIDKPWESEKCLKCHVTGFGEPEEMFKKSFDPEQGVQCETCHGPAELHKKARFRAAADEDDGEEGFGDEEGQGVPEFVQIPDDELIKSPKRDLCYTCHNDESPTTKHFCYYKNVNTIRHLDPRNSRTEEQLDKLYVCKLGDDCNCTEETCEDICPIEPSKLKDAKKE